MTLAETQSVAAAASVAGRTPPRTSFQPVSSSTSSVASTALYRLKSRCSVRIMIMATCGTLAAVSRQMSTAA